MYRWAFICHRKESGLLYDSGLTFWTSICKEIRAHQKKMNNWEMPKVILEKTCDPVRILATVTAPLVTLGCGSAWMKCCVHKNTGRASHGQLAASTRSCSCNHWPLKFSSAHSLHTCAGAHTELKNSWNLSMPYETLCRNVLFCTSTVAFRDVPCSVQRYMVKPLAEAKPV